MSEETLVLRESYARRVVLALALSFRAQWYFFVPALLYLGTNWLMLRNVPNHGVAPTIAVLMDLLTFSLPVGLIVAMVLRMAQYALIEKPKSPVHALWAEIRELAVHPSRVINAVPVLLAMVLFNKAMVELKPAIPQIKPFAWDETFMHLDRALHFGVDPWVLLQPLMGYDWITWFVNMAYNFWFVVLIGAWFWFGFRKEASQLRSQFFLAYMLIWWVGGGLLAVYFSSAGPVYYGGTGHSPDPFAPLMSYLHDVDSRLPIWCLKTQKLLWDGYTGKVAALGISAFPSMHNGSAVLFAMATSRVSRPVGIFFWCYAAVILLGSVHLGWHYALDGYAGIIIGLLGWYAAGIVARWVHRGRMIQRYNEELAAL